MPDLPVEALLLCINAIAAQDCDQHVVAMLHVQVGEEYRIMLTLALLDPTFC